MGARPVPKPKGRRKCGALTLHPGGGRSGSPETLGTGSPTPPARPPGPSSPSPLCASRHVRLPAITPPQSRAVENASGPAKGRLPGLLPTPPARGTRLVQLPAAQGRPSVPEAGPSCSAATAPRTCCRRCSPAARSPQGLCFCVHPTPPRSVH